MVNILIIGGGGREHALAWKLKQSPKIAKIFVAPGNGGTSQVAENVNIPATNISALAEFARQNNIYLTVVGQDDPLALGITDEFQKLGLRIWGPTQAAAKIESSKAFAKQLMKEMNVPTADFETFNDYEKALRYVREKGAPIVIKASGLALGKGVTVCKTLQQAETALKEAMLEKAFGNSGNEVVVEEFMEGPEFSIHAFCDGKHYQILPAAQDHKTAFTGNLGPNTGGMGTVAPVPWVDDSLLEDVKLKIIEPILQGLQKHGSPFLGLLYPGLMLTKNGPKVIEFNARFGDPETQSLMRLLKTDLFDILEASINGQLNSINIEWQNAAACCIALASGGYPGKYEKGKKITGIADAEMLIDIIIFHAGTLIQNGSTITNGGRVLGITATGLNLKEALDKAYAAAKLINFEGVHYRTDIGWQSISSKL